MSSYGSTTGVQALVPEVAVLSGSTTPNTTQVTQWLAEGNAKIARAISSAGYVVPVSGTIALSAELTGLANLYAAAYVLRAQGIDTASGEGEDRSEIWLADFYAQLKDIAMSDLSLLGATPLPSTTPMRRRRIRTLQMRKVDGYSRGAVGEVWQVAQGEYTGASAPSE